MEFQFFLRIPYHFLITNSGFQIYCNLFHICGVHYRHASPCNFCIFPVRIYKENRLFRTNPSDQLEKIKRDLPRRLNYGVQTPFRPCIRINDGISVDGKRKMLASRAWSCCLETGSQPLLCRETLLRLYTVINTWIDGTLTATQWIYLVIL